MQFQLHKDGQQVAKSLSELRALAREGKLAQDEWLYDERTQSWLGAAQVPELKDAWNIGEEDRTVSLQVSPELLAALAAQQAARSAPRGSRHRVGRPGAQGFRLRNRSQRHR